MRLERNNDFGLIKKKGTESLSGLCCLLFSVALVVPVKPTLLSPLQF